MRGKQNSFHMDANGIGLIPAHAGKTGLGGLAATLTGAHPRACGENGVVSGDAWPSTGSSPRMRGKLRATLENVADERLIPAHAGKTISFAGSCAPPRAHPRACGENALPAFHRYDMTGSSPRMRGKPAPLWLALAASGLIPAHAGKTRPTQLAAALNWAHPRACGENFAS